MTGNSFPSIVPSEDFWSRQANAQRYAFDCAPYGIPTRITANQAELLSAARLSVRRYSTAVESGSQPITIHIVVKQGASRPVPDDFVDRLVYSGVGEWISLSAGEWGHGFAHLTTRVACVFLSPALAGDARLVSRYFIDHHVLNLILTEWAMLHASCVLDASQQRLIVMVAPHDTGKSTAALRLTHAGYTFLADGMVVLREREGRLIVGGYPVGEVKLRDDVLALFPEYAGETVHAREQRKTIVDLRAAHPERVAESLVTPSSVQVCFVERHAGARTQVARMDRAEAIPIVSANTAYWNDASQLEHNTSALHFLLRTARLYRLHLGADPDDLIRAINDLLDSVDHESDTS